MTAEHPQNTVPREVISHVITSEDLAKANRKRIRKNLYLLRNLTKNGPTDIRGDNVTFAITREPWFTTTTFRVAMYQTDKPQAPPLEVYQINRNMITGKIATGVHSRLGLALPGITQVSYKRSEYEWDSILDSLADRLRNAGSRGKPRRQRF